MAEMGNENAHMNIMVNEIRGDAYNVVIFKKKKNKKKLPQCLSPLFKRLDVLYWLLQCAYYVEAGKQLKYLGK